MSQNDGATPSEKQENPFDKTPPKLTNSIPMARTTRLPTKEFFRRGARIILPGTFVLLTTLVILVLVAKNNKSAEIKDRFLIQEGILSQVVATFDVEFAHAFTDIHVVKYEAKALAQHCDTRNYSHAECEDAKFEFEDYLVHFSHRGKYFQLRYINRTGWETVRVDYNRESDTPVIVQDLQDKSDRYYFQDAINNHPEDVYLSLWDWNIENGEIQEPRVGTLRIAATVPDSHGNINGLVLINFYADTILENRILSKNLHRFHILDENGYWIHHPYNANQQMGFMFKDKHAWTFQETYPELWKHMETHASKDFQHFENRDNLLSYIKFCPPQYTRNNEEDSSDRVYVLATLQDPEIINSQSASYIAAIVGVSLFSIILLIVATYFYVRTKWRLEVKSDLAARLAEIGGIDFDKIASSPKALEHVDVDECIRKAKQSRSVEFTSARKGSRTTSTRGSRTTPSRASTVSGGVTPGKMCVDIPRGYSSRREEKLSEDPFPTMKSILDDRIGNAFFLRYCSNLACPELVMFWRDSVTFEYFITQSLRSMEELYIQEGAAMQLNLPSHMREAFPVEWKNEEIEEIKHHVEHLLALNHLNSFKQSDLYETLMHLREIDYIPSSGIHKV